MKKVNLGNLLLSWRGLVFLVLLVWLSLKQLKTMNPQTEKIFIKNKLASDVYFLLIENGFNFIQARFITAQAGHETGDFKSIIFKENNNCFGMKLALIRKTTAIGQNRGHAKYNSIEDSVKDFAIYYKSWKYLPVYNSIDAYVKALVKRGYFEASPEAYKEAMIFFYKLYFENAVNV